MIYKFQQISGSDVGENKIIQTNITDVDCKFSVTDGINENQLRITSNQNWSAAGSTGTNRQDELGLFYLVYDLTFEIH